MQRGTAHFRNSISRRPRFDLLAMFRLPLPISEEPSLLTNKNGCSILTHKRHTGGMVRAWAVRKVTARVAAAVITRLKMRTLSQQ
jgi:hypothetical protein